MMMMRLESKVRLFISPVCSLELEIEFHESNQLLDSHYLLIGPCLPAGLCVPFENAVDPIVAHMRHKVVAVDADVQFGRSNFVSPAIVINQLLIFLH